MTKAKKWLSRYEVCQAIGISLSSLFRRVKDGTIPKPYYIKLGGRVLFSHDLVTDLPRLLQNGAGSPGEEGNGAKEAV